ncbi:hypothetical protein C4F49_16750 [Sphingobacterium sp. KB22]|uniref:Uncharacterized protein n=1 Tax=Sphingobacterium hungaricum TaxID=2082723 RepID=A0A928V3A2_9SPHI|nr:hypothetical protein [Sphingobacterium hungaricum]
MVDFEGKNYVFESLGNNKFQLLNVEVGESGNEYVEVKNYSDFINKSIVSKGAYALLMALKNKVE